MVNQETLKSILHQLPLCQLTIILSWWIIIIKLHSDINLKWQL
jgi:hypothetical protein